MKIPDRLIPLVEDGIIEEVIGQVKSGKEADVFVVRVGDELRCAKVYKDANNRSFRQAVQYQEGRKVRNSRDARAIGKRSRYGQKEAESSWINAEVEALNTLSAAGLRVPKPFGFFDGVLIMELVMGEDGEPAPRLNDITLSAETAFLYHEEMIAQIVKMLCCGIIHGDLSEFNVLVDADGPVIIDLPQAVNAAGNNSAPMMFARDVDNMARYFGRFAPEILGLKYAKEIWALYEKGKLTPHVELTGQFQEPTKRVDVSGVLDAIGDARKEHEDRQLKKEGRDGKEFMDRESRGPGRPAEEPGGPTRMDTRPVRNDLAGRNPQPGRSDSGHRNFDKQRMSGNPGGPGAGGYRGNQGQGGGGQGTGRPKSGGPSGGGQGPGGQGPGGQGPGGQGPRGPRGPGPGSDRERGHGGHGNARPFQGDVRHLGAQGGNFQGRPPERGPGQSRPVERGPFQGGSSPRGPGQGRPSERGPSPDRPSEKETSQGISPQGGSPEGRSPQGNRSQGMSPQGGAPQGNRSQGMSPEGRSRQGNPPQGKSPQETSPQEKPTQDISQGGKPPQGKLPGDGPTEGGPQWGRRNGPGGPRPGR